LKGIKKGKGIRSSAPEKEGNRWQRFHPTLDITSMRWGKKKEKKRKKERLLQIAAPEAPRRGKRKKRRRSIITRSLERKESKQEFFAPDPAFREKKRRKGSRFAKFAHSPSEKERRKKRNAGKETNERR